MWWLIGVLIITAIGVYEFESPTPPNVPTTQPDSSIVITNDTSLQFLHVFLQVVDNKPWTVLSHTGATLYPQIDWGEHVEGKGVAWDPLGAKIAQECVIAQKSSVTLHIPDTDGHAFVIMAVHMVSDTDQPLVLRDGLHRRHSTIAKVKKQAPLLIEAGKDMVADTSAVDGINFRVTYSLTTGTDTIQTMRITRNPCANISEKYQLEVGCQNPAKVECSTATVDCMPGTQNCKFNECTDKLFNIPNSMEKYKYEYDDGDKTNKPVKRLANNSQNLKDNALKQFCTDIQHDSGDFTTYCYDYNDVGSSPWFRAPYKITVNYQDL